MKYKYKFKKFFYKFIAKLKFIMKSHKLIKRFINWLIVKIYIKKLTHSKLLIIDTSFMSCMQWKNINIIFIILYLNLYSLSD